MANVKRTTIAQLTDGVELFFGYQNNSPTGKIGSMSYFTLNVDGTFSDYTPTSAIQPYGRGVDADQLIELTDDTGNIFFGKWKTSPFLANKIEYFVLENDGDFATYLPTGSVIPVGEFPATTASSAPAIYTANRNTRNALSGLQVGQRVYVLAEEILYEWSGSSFLEIHQEHDHYPFVKSIVGTGEYFLSPTELTRANGREYTLVIDGSAVLTNATVTVQNYNSGAFNYGDIITLNFLVTNLSSNKTFTVAFGDKWRGYDLSEQMFDIEISPNLKDGTNKLFKVEFVYGDSESYLLSSTGARNIEYFGTGLNFERIGASQLLEPDHNYAIDKSGLGAVTYTLPLVSDAIGNNYYTLRDGSHIRLYDESNLIGRNATDRVTLQAQGTDTIDGQTSIQLTIPGGVWNLHYSAATQNWSVDNPYQQRDEAVGSVFVGDINFGSGPRSFAGDVTSATKDDSPANGTLIFITHPFVFNPAVFVSIESVGTMESDNDLAIPVVRNITNTGFTVFLEETVNSSQSVRLFFISKSLTSV